MAQVHTGEDLVSEDDQRLIKKWCHSGKEQSSLSLLFRPRHFWLLSGGGIGVHE